jgi:hypothetical protein
VVKGFILGAITGGAIVWFWGREIRELIDAKTQGAREAVADRLETAASGLQSTAEKLQRAKESLEAGMGGV